MLIGFVVLGALGMRADTNTAMTLDLGGGVKMEFVLIPAGTFMMGSTSYQYSQPVHQVTLTHPFYMAKYVVTQQQYDQVMGLTVTPSTATNPVNGIAWIYVTNFCSLVNAMNPNTIGPPTDLDIDYAQKCGSPTPILHVRLPTEAEWEFACRAGTATEYYFGDTTNLLPQYAWNPGMASHPVGQKLPNAWGLYDMHGDVLEYCLDGGANGVYYSPAAATNPCAAWTTHRIFRYGASGYRENWNIYMGEGFRLVVDMLVPTVSNDGGASNVVNVSATLNGQLVSTGTSGVSVCWGTVDHGTNTVAWDHVINFGQYPMGAVSTNVTGLTPGLTYYYRFNASNWAGVAWADTSAQFTTESSPAIDNISGATSITPVTARLTGTLTAGGNASVTVYWGTTDGGTTAASWQHTNSIGAVTNGAFSCAISMLNPSTAYSYRCYATNSAGSAWAGSTASFQTAPLLANGSAFGMKIRFAGYNKAETLTNFPALVMFGTNIQNFAYDQMQSPNGWDLRFTTSNQVTPLNYEIAQWTTNGNSYVWVQVPAISSSNDYIWAYWGNPSAAGQPAACTTNGSTWDANCFKGVWHLGEKLTQNQSTGTNYDSTSYGNHGLQRNNGWTNGIVGSAQSFNGSNAYINTVASMTNGAMTNTMTLSLWVNVLGPWDWSSTMTMLNQYNGNVNYYFNNQVKQKQALNMGTADRSGNSSLSTGVWTYLTVTFLSPGGYNSTCYMNGAYDGTASRVDKPGASGSWCFGKSGGGAYSYFPGLMEEIRVEQVQRSSNWVWACYQTMAANSLFSSYQIQPGSMSNAATIHGIPYSWLGSYGITNTNDSVETENPDGDSLNNLQEYIAGTDPTNRNSCFYVSITNSAGQVIVRVPSVQATDGKTRYYDIELRTNLMFGSWQPVPGYTNIPGDGNLISCTNLTQDPAKFYRVKVWLQ
jgi:formylglycine-generating enzyme required for sulfatase activity